MQENRPGGQTFETYAKFKQVCNVAVLFFSLAVGYLFVPEFFAVAAIMIVIIFYDYKRIKKPGAKHAS
jgi:hypothetical protein